MKIKIENNDIKIKVGINIPDGKMLSGSSANIMNITENFLNVLNSYLDSLKAEVSIQKPVPAKTTPHKAEAHPERPLVRDRLPNNVVDIKKLDIKQAAQDEALVRCPNCGQAHALIVHSGDTMYVMRKSSDKKHFDTAAVFDYKDADKCMKTYTMQHGMEDYKNFMLRLLKLDALSIDFMADNDTEVFCPVCHSSNTFSRWKEAYDEPLRFFESDMLCDACGGTMYSVKNKSGAVKLVCDKCGYTKGETDEY